MASTKDYKNFVIEQLSILDGITYKPMMGEYILYYNGIIFGGIYDDRLLVKITDTNKEFAMEEAIPYPKGKPMYLVSDIDNQDTLRDIVLETIRGLNK
jgi:TfoX/Sxy family transcriptional regulator of competence genes